MPTERNAFRAACWCSGSMSTLVRIPSGCMPANSASPETPDPVPISTTAFACDGPGQQGQGARRIRDRAETRRTPRPSAERPHAASDSSTKSSAYAQDAGLGATWARSCRLRRFTDVSLVESVPAPYDGDMSHTVVAELVAAVLKVEVEVGDSRWRPTTRW